jgi:signal peptidase I
LLRNTLVLHEGKQAEIRNDTLYIEGRPSQHCYFTKDYYWMASNNSVNLSDSRLFGFVPQDHVIGKLHESGSQKQTIRESLADTAGNDSSNR